MKILFVLPTLGNGGAERVASLLCNALSLENEIEILLLENDSICPYHIESSVVVKNLNLKTKKGHRKLSIISYALNFHKMRKFVLNEIKNFKPSTLISFLPKADILVSSLNLKGVNWIASERNDPWMRGRIESKLLTKAYKKSDYLVVQTRNIYSYYSNKGVEKIEIIKNPVIIKDSMIKINNKIEYPFFLSVGRLDSQKGFDNLIKTYFDLHKKYSIEHKLIILGDGPEKASLEKLIEKYCLKENVLLLGRKDDVSTYYSQASFFVMSSKYEGMPNALMEAMTFGLPAICTDFSSGAARELISKENGIIVPVNDSEKLGEAIWRLISLDEAELLKMGNESLKIIKKYSLQEIIEKWKNIII